MEPVVLRCGMAILSAAGAALLVRVFDRRSPRRAVDGLTLAMSVCAAVYPVARLGTRRVRSVASGRETAGVVLWGGGSLCLLFMPMPGRRLGAAAGWALHAVFDLLHEPGPESALPRWYRSVCAGADVGVAAALIVGADRSMVESTEPEQVAR